MRLPSLTSGKAKLTLPPPERESVPGVDTLRRAAAEAAELLTTKRLTWAWAVPAPLMLRSDAPLFYLLARDLLVAVARGADQEGAITVQATLPSGRDGGTLEVWRDAAFNHPTLAEAYKVAALNGFNRLSERRG